MRLRRWSGRAWGRGIQIPLAWVLAYPVAMGPNGVFTAIAVSYATLAVVSVVIFQAREVEGGRRLGNG